MRKYILPCVLVLLVALTALTGYKAWQYRSALIAASPSDPYHISRYLAENEQLAKGDAERVVFLGDSLTFRWQLPATIGTMRVVNRGIGSDTTDGMLGRFSGDVVGLKPERVVILAGINDLARSLGGGKDGVAIVSRKVEGNIRLMVQIAKENGIQPVLASLMPVNEMWGANYQELNTASKAMNVRLADLAKSEGVPYADYWAQVADSQTQSLQADLTTDGIHLNQTGYDRLLDAVKPALDSM